MNIRNEDYIYLLDQLMINLLEITNKEMSVIHQLSVYHKSRYVSIL